MEQRAQNLKTRLMKGAAQSLTTSAHVLAAIVLVIVLAPHAGSAPNLAGAQPGPTAASHLVPSSSPSSDGARSVAVNNIPPLYREPALPGEGAWRKEELSGGQDAADLIYRTFYQPSAQFPNAVVYMMLINMEQISARLYLGSGEPYRKESPTQIEDRELPQLLTVTNALWQTRHAGGGGIICRGKVLKEMEPGLATIVVYKNESVDILEWNDEIAPVDVQDARQLKHLIVKEGKVVTSIVRKGQIRSAEIGMGSLLNEEQPVVFVPASSPGEKPTYKLNITSGDLWFLATRSAFGIRPDGNLVFAVGHHINTCDLAKALVLAGCVRAIHGDSNPGNCVGVLYFREGNGKIANTVALSPLQDKSTLQRYLKESYPKDFFGFFRRLKNGG